MVVLMKSPQSISLNLCGACLQKEKQNDGTKRSLAHLMVEIQEVRERR